MNSNIEAIRLDENNQIIKSLLKISKIIKTKCERCNPQLGCMGCIFSPGEMVGDIGRCIELMEKMPHDKDLIKQHRDLIFRFEEFGNSN